MGVYAWYHLSALQKASRLANEPDLSQQQRQEISSAMLADEGFALHFLEDMFASGHVAGTWGEVSQRLGTHNYYNPHGLEVYTWNREDYPVVLLGDAHMRQQNLQLAANTISTSIKQVLDFAAGRDTGYPQPYFANASTTPRSFNVCSNDTFPEHPLGTDYNPPLKAVLNDTPMPGLGGTEYGTLPRFRSKWGLLLALQVPSMPEQSMAVTWNHRMRKGLYTVLIYHSGQDSAWMV